MAQIKDEKTGKMREETDDERKAREALEAAGDDDDAGDDAPDSAKLTEQVTHWKTEARKWEKRAKDTFASKVGIPWDDVTAAAQKYTELEARNKSETERATEAQKASDARAAKAERELLVMRIAVKKGLSEIQAKRLVGETEEELEADADELLKSFKRDDEDEDDASSTNGSVKRRPAEVVRSGSGKVKEPPFDAKKVVDQVMGVSS